MITVKFIRELPPPLLPHVALALAREVDAGVAWASDLLEEVMAHMAAHSTSSPRRSRL